MFQQSKTKKLAAQQEELAQTPNALSSLFSPETPDCAHVKPLRNAGFQEKMAKVVLVEINYFGSMTPAVAEFD